MYYTWESSVVEVCQENVVTRLLETAEALSQRYQFAAKGFTGLLGFLFLSSLIYAFLLVPLL